VPEARTSVHEAHERSVTMDIAGVAGYLQEVLGQKLVAHIASVRDPKGVGQWARGTQVPRLEAERRLRATYQILHLLLTVDSPHVARAWFIGMNPQLDDEAPADIIREGHLREALVAAQAFVSGG
jgi:hypothetical protein